MNATGVWLIQSVKSYLNVSIVTEFLTYILAHSANQNTYALIIIEEKSTHMSISMYW